MASDIPWMRTEATQKSLNRLAQVLGMVPCESGKLWLSGGPSDGWWLSGCKGGDCKLPMTKGANTAREAFERAWGWLAPEIESLNKKPERSRLVGDMCVYTGTTAELVANCPPPSHRPAPLKPS